jgi:pimeloyl-ACP methyl ester carboxylesterase
LIINAYTQISKLILTGSAGLVLEKKKNTLLNIIPSFLKKGILKEIGINLFGSKDYKNASPRMREILKKVIAEDLISYAEKVYVPTLLVWGDKDKATPPEIGKKFNAIIAHSKLEILENCGHYAFLDKKDEFMYIINKFIH